MKTLGNLFYANINGVECLFWWKDNYLDVHEVESDELIFNTRRLWRYVEINDRLHGAAWWAFTNKRITEFVAMHLKNPGINNVEYDRQRAEQ